MVSRATDGLPSLPTEKTHDLSDFADFLLELNAEGFEFVVIGGCAVIAYANLLGEDLFSADLDIYTTQETLAELLKWAPFCLTLKGADNLHRSVYGPFRAGDPPELTQGCAALALGYVVRPLWGQNP